MAADEPEIDALAALEERVRIAEERVDEAERRLQALIEKVEASERSITEPGTDAERDLRARLVRTASKKKPSGREDR